MNNNNEPLNQIPVSTATPVEPTEPAPTQPKPSPKKVSNPIYYFLVICGGVVLLLWLIGSQQQPAPLTAQANTPTPIATGWEVEITRTVTITPTRTPWVIGVIVTVFPTPTPAPTATPTPTFEPLSDKPIMGYVFSPPQQILQDNFMEIVDWLPNSSEEMLIRTFADDHYLIEKLNIKTGTRQTLVKTKLNIIGNPVWLSATQQTAYIGQIEPGKYNLYYSSGNDHLHQTYFV